MDKKKKPQEPHGYGSQGLITRVAGKRLNCSPKPLVEGSIPSAPAKQQTP